MISPHPQPLDTKYVCTEIDLQTLTGYFNAALIGHEKIAPLKLFWEQQLGIIRATHSAAGEVEKVLRPDVLYFALCMERELRKHDKERGYRGWQGYIGEEEREFLIRRCHQEVEETVQEIGFDNKNPEREPPHIGNFAMMLQTAHLSTKIIAHAIPELITELRAQQKGEP